MKQFEIGRGSARRQRLVRLAGCLVVQMSLVAMPALPADETRLLDGGKPAVVPVFPSAPDAEWSGPMPATAKDRSAATSLPSDLPSPLSPSAVQPALALGSAPADGPGPRLQAAAANAARSAPVMTRLTRYNRRSVANRGDVDAGSMLRVAAPAAPGFNLIECIAGCLTDRRVVYYEPRSEAVLPSKAAPAAGGIASAVTRVADSAAVICVAGCYTTPKSYPAKPAAPRQQLALGASLVGAETVAGSIVPAAAAASVTEPSAATPRFKRLRRLHSLARSGRPVRLAHGKAAKVIKVAARL